MKTWHLLCVVAIIAGVGALLILAKTIAQAVIGPELVTDDENRHGTTVSWPHTSILYGICSA